MTRGREKNRKTFGRATALHKHRLCLRTRHRVFLQYTILIRRIITLQSFEYIIHDYHRS